MTEKNVKAEKASTTLATMLDYLGLNATVKAEEKDGKITLVTYSEEAGRIIGKKGQSLQSLELLLNRMTLKEDLDSQWINIDVDGYSSGRQSSRSSNGRPPYKRRGDRPGGRKPYNRDSAPKESYSERPERTSRERRPSGDNLAEEQLKQMALDAAKEVKRWGDPVTLKAMNSHDRRIIHMTLKEDTSINTESKPVPNNDKLKKVIITARDN